MTDLSLPLKVVSAAQMRRIEDRSEQTGVSKDTLMESAGLEVARAVRRRIGHLPGVRVLVLVGPGNNGGDGLVAARHLHRWGARVLAYLCGSRPSPDPKLDLLRELGTPVARASDDEDLASLREWLSLSHAVVDSVLGTGRSRPIQGALASILGEVSLARSRRPDLPLLALDVPTGLDADTGAVDPLTPPPDVTLALGYPKLGMFALPGAASVGAYEVLDIGIPPGLDDDVKVELMTAASAARLAPPRPLAAHKGSFGRALVVAGSPNYVGAARLAALAATRVGAGLVTLATPRRPPALRRGRRNRADIHPAAGVLPRLRRPGSRRFPAPRRHGATTIRSSSAAASDRTSAHATCSSACSSAARPYLPRSSTPMP